MTARSETVAVAESLTGGLVVATLVGVPGASAVVRGGVVAYATPVKASVLGVDAALLAARGAVDPEVARQMAAGVRSALSVDGE
ncbi:MAG: nicotinamide-nucleotide amidohydrolase family protein, partial [Curtobacterium sp.]